MGSRVVRTRTFALTAHYDTDDEKDEHVVNLQECGYKYACYGEEVCPSTGRKHLQAYVMFANPRKFAQVKSLLPRMHIESAKGSPIQNIKYCEKSRVVDDGLEVDDIPNEVFVEFGERPKDTGKAGGEANKRKWETTLQLAKAGDLEEICPEMTIRYYSTLKRIQRDYEPFPEKLSGTCGLWYYGASGTGKSFAAMQEYPGAYLKMPNKWWDGYQGEDVVILDDFGKDHAYLVNLLKLWGDENPFKAEYKGGTMNIRPKLFIVTSNWRHSEIWTEWQSLEPIERRFPATRFASLRDQGARNPRDGSGDEVRPGFVGAPGFRLPRAPLPARAVPRHAPHPPRVPRPILGEQLNHPVRSNEDQHQLALNLLGDVSLVDSLVGGVAGDELPPSPDNLGSPFFGTPPDDPFGLDFDWL